MRAGRWIGTAVVGWALAIGCAGSPQTTTEEAPVAEATDSDVAPEFELPTLAGETFRFADTAGNVRLVDFWATWCAPCREEIPMLQGLHDELGPQGFSLIAISDENAEDLRGFVEEKQVSYVNLVDEGGLIGDRYDVPGLPTAYLIDRDGKIVETFLGEKPARILRKRIEALLAEPAEQAALID